MHIVLTMSGALPGVSGYQRAFTVVVANTCPHVADVVVSGTSVILILSAAIAYGKIITGIDFIWGSPNVLIPSTTQPGIYYVGILVDCTNAVTEGNETNNYPSVQITVN